MKYDEFPDLPELKSNDDIYSLYNRDSFRVVDKVFKKTEPGEYKFAGITVYCDQQDSTSWAAKVGSLSTGYYWAPEHAVAELLKSIGRI